MTDTKRRIVAVKGLDGKLKCEHEWVIQTTGSTHFCQGETWDDIEEVEVCKWCGEVGIETPTMDEQIEGHSIF
jgi:hypothetical protein